jgi:hypothetical protein
MHKIAEENDLGFGHGPDVDKGQFLKKSDYKVMNKENTPNSGKKFREKGIEIFQ